MKIYNEGRVMKRKRREVRWQHNLAFCSAREVGSDGGRGDSYD